MLTLSNDQLEVVLGTRVDWYDGDHPDANPAFLARYGFNNTTGFSLVGGATIASAGENKTGGNGGAGAPNGSVPLE